MAAVTTDDLFDPEFLESLEQLRLLEHGMTMQVEEACCPVPAGVDTKQDLERVRTALAP